MLKHAFLTLFLCDAWQNFPELKYFYIASISPVNLYRLLTITKFLFHIFRFKLRDLKPIEATRFSLQIKWLNVKYL